MKKILVMSALVALSAAFVACSNENDLVQQKPEVPEEPTVQYPMTISVTTPTRGTDLTAATLNDFKLYSSIDASWYNGAVFKKVNDQWANINSAVMGWNTNPKTKYKFYGISDFANITGAGTASPAIPSVNDTENPISFGYTMPSTTQNAEGLDVVAYADQNDLLVCNTECSYEDGDPDGNLAVNFTHALAQIIKIRVYCNPNNMLAGDVPYWHFRVGGIRIGGLKRVGTYTFDPVAPATSWAVSGDDAEFEIPLDIPVDDPTDPVNGDAAFNRMCFVPGAKVNNADPTSPSKTTLDLPLTDGGLYLIPQSVAGSLESVGLDYTVEGAYAEIDLQGMQDQTSLAGGYVYHVCNEEVETNWDAEGSKANGFQRVRVPLTFDITAGSGKGYTLVIDISNAVVWEDTDNTNRGEGNLVLGDSMDFTL